LNDEESGEQKNLGGHLFAEHGRFRTAVALLPQGAISLSGWGQDRSCQPSRSIVELHAVLNDQVRYSTPIGTLHPEPVDV
jgi:hypothetical protein